jgi:hypothetical protein
MKDFDFVPLECELVYKPDDLPRVRKVMANQRKNNQQYIKSLKSTDSLYLIEDKYLNNLFMNSYNVIKKEIKLDFTEDELIDLKKMCFNVMKQHIGNLCFGKIDNKALLRTELKILCRKTIKEANRIKQTT